MLGSVSHGVGVVRSYLCGGVDTGKNSVLVV